MTHTVEDIGTLLQDLRLIGMKENFQLLAEEKTWNPLNYLYELSQLEHDYRVQKKIEGLLKRAKMPREKTIADFDFKRIPELHPGKVRQLCEGSFIDRLENLLIFGNPGTGKTHLAIAFAKEWCLRGRRVLYTTSAKLVQQLLQEKKALSLNACFKRLDRFEVLIIDDISYVPYDRAEMDVLFLLLSERYEQRSTVITSNLAFSKWNQIFKDDMTTAAAVDRLVHHSIILELNTLSYRMEKAKKTKSAAIAQVQHNQSKKNKEKNEKED